MKPGAAAFNEHGKQMANIFNRFAHVLRLMYRTDVENSELVRD